MSRAPLLRPFARRFARAPSGPRPLLRAARAAVLLGLVAFLAGPAAMADTPVAASLDPATARAELRFAADTLLAVHPALVTPEARAALEAELAADEARLGDAPTADEVALALQLLLASLDDAHTTAAPQATAQRYLPLGFLVLSDGILVSPVGGIDTGLPAAGRLIRMGDLTPEALQARMAALVPGTDAWVGYRLGQLANAEPVLRWLGVVEGAEGGAAEGATVRVTVEDSEGATVTASVPLVPVAQLAQATSPLQALLQRAVGVGQDWSHRGQTWMWRIDEASGTGIFWLLSCVDSPDYRAAVDDFFRAVVGAGVQRVVLDLRFDGGGNSEVATAFLRHLPARVIRGYGVTVRPSDAVTAQRGTDAAALERSAVGRAGDLLVVRAAGTPTLVPLTLPVFRGDVTVLVNGATFSSAGMVAVMLRDNGLARVAGEPMGAEPGGYGDILQFTTPALGLPFTVSYKRFERPDRSAGERLAIDEPVALTAADVLAGRDVVAGWLDREAP